MQGGDRQPNNRGFFSRKKSTIMTVVGTHTLIDPEAIPIQYEVIPSNLKHSNDCTLHFPLKRGLLMEFHRKAYLRAALQRIC